MKKFTAFLTAIVLAGASCSCSKNTESSNVTSASPQSSYKSAAITMADGFSELVNIDSNSSSGKILIFGRLPSGAYSGYVTDKEFSEYEEFELSPEKDETVLGACLCGFGKKAVLTCKNDSTFIHVISAEGKEEKLLDCGSVITPYEGGELYGSIYKNGSGFVICDHDMALYSVSEEGTAEPVQFKGMSVFGICPDGDVVKLLLNAPDGESCFASVEGNSVADEKRCGAKNSSAAAMCCGSGEYEYIAVFMDGIFGYKDDDWVQLSDLTELSFGGYSVRGIVSCGDGELAVLRDSKGGRMLEMLSERDISEIKAKKVVKVAVTAQSDVELNDMVSKYNSENDDGEYTVKLVSYDPDGKLLPEDAVRNLKLDIISGNAPDIITSPIDGVAPNEYYVDLYEYLENDSELKASDFLPEYLEGAEINGKLPFLSPGFCYETKCAYSGIDGVKENWSYDDFMTAYSSMPEGMKLLSNQEFIYITANFLSFITVEDFVDKEKASCCFESQEFIKMMKFFKENHIGMNKEETQNTYVGDVLYDPMAIRNKKTLVYDSRYEFGNYFQTVKGVFDEMPVFVGKPSLNGKGTVSTAVPMTFSILKNSECPDGAWDFIKSGFTDSYYKEIGGMSGVPTVEKYFEAFSELCIEPSKRKDEYIAECSVQNKYYTDPERKNSFDMEYLDDKELEECRKFMRNAARNLQSPDSALNEIMYNELDEYFNGDRSAEETARLIQNRASIYLSENYG